MRVFFSALLFVGLILQNFFATEAVSADFSYQDEVVELDAKTARILGLDELADKLESRANHYELKFDRAVIKEDLYFLPASIELEHQNKVVNEQQSISPNSRLAPQNLIYVEAELASDGRDYSEVDLGFCLEVDGNCHDLLVWNYKTQIYDSVYNVHNMVKESPTGVALNFLLPEDLVNTLKDRGLKEPESFKIFSKVVTDDAELDNVFLTELKLMSLSDDLSVNPSLSKSLSRNDTRELSYSWNPSYGSKEVSVKPFFKTAVRVYKPHSYAYANAGLNVSIFGNTFEMVKGEARGDVVTEGVNEASAHVYVRFLKYVYLYNREWSYATEWKGKKGWRKEKGISKTIMIYIIPVKLEAGVGGEIGVQWKFSIENGVDDFYAKAGPYVAVDAYVSAAITLGIAWGGVKGTLRILADNLWLSLHLKTQTPRLYGSLYNDIWGPRGDIGPYAGYYKPYVRWSRSCFKAWWRRWCVSYPHPGVRKKEKYWPIASFSTGSWRHYLHRF